MASDDLLERIISIRPEEADEEMIAQLQHLESERSYPRAFEATTSQLLDLKFRIETAPDHQPAGLTLSTGQREHIPTSERVHDLVSLCQHGCSITQFFGRKEWRGHDGRFTALVAVDRDDRLLGYMVLWDPSATYDTRSNKLPEVLQYHATYIEELSALTGGSFLFVVDLVVAHPGSLLVPRHDGEPHVSRGVGSALLKQLENRHLSSHADGGAAHTGNLKHNVTVLAGTVPHFNYSALNFFHKQRYQIVDHVAYVDDSTSPFRRVFRLCCVLDPQLLDKPPAHQDGLELFLRIRAARTIRQLSRPFIGTRPTSRLLRAGWTHDDQHLFGASLPFSGVLFSQTYMTAVSSARKLLRRAMRYNLDLANDFRTARHLVLQAARKLRLAREEIEEEADVEQLAGPPVSQLRHMRHWLVFAAGELPNRYSRQRLNGVLRKALRFGADDAVWLSDSQGDAEVLAAVSRTVESDAWSKHLTRVFKKYWRAAAGIYIDDTLPEAGRSLWLHLSGPTARDGDAASQPGEVGTSGESGALGCFFTLLVKFHPSQNHDDFDDSIDSVVAISWKSFSASFTQLALRLRADALQQLASQHAQTALMAQNMSHHIGSHILASPLCADLLASWMSARPTTQARTQAASALRDAKVDRTTAVQSFCSYLAARMEFITSWMFSVPASAEAMNLWSDLFGSLFEQHIVMGLLASDRFASLRFRVLSKTGPTDATDAIEWSPGTAASKPTKENLLTQRLVSVAGGVLGVSAVHVLLENVIRNAATHASLDIDARHELVVTIAITYDAGTRQYNIEVDDGISPPSAAHEMIKNMRRRRRAATSGMPVVGGSGMGAEECAACARILAGPGRAPTWEPMDRTSDGRQRLVYPIRMSEPVVLAVETQTALSHEARAAGVVAMSANLTQCASELALFRTSARRCGVARVLGPSSAPLQKLPLYVPLQPGELVDLMPNDGADSASWERAVLAIRSRWLRQFVSPEQSTTLVIRVPRNHRLLMADAVAELAKVEASLPGTHIVVSDSLEVVMRDVHAGVVMVYDHHGAASDLWLSRTLRRSWAERRFYHAFGESSRDPGRARRLGSTIDYLVGSVFQTGWRVLDLIEGALISVAIFDERVHQAMLQRQQPERCIAAAAASGTYIVDTLEVYSERDKYEIPIADANAHVHGYRLRLRQMPYGWQSTLIGPTGGRETGLVGVVGEPTIIVVHEGLLSRCRPGAANVLRDVARLNAGPPVILLDSGKASRRWSRDASKVGEAQLNAQTVPLELLKSTIVDDWSKPALVRGLLNAMDLSAQPTHTERP